MTGEGFYRNIVCSYLAACILLGGASAAGIGANLLLQVAAIPLAMLGVLRIAGAPCDRRHIAAFAIGAGMLALPLLQLIPLTPAMWSSLPGRQVIVDGFATLQMPLPWLPLSFDPIATLASWLALLPAAAIFLAALSLDPAERVWIGGTVLVLGLVSALLAIAQFASHLPYFYEITSRDSGVGFFANRNHLATLMLVAIPTLTLQHPAMRAQPLGAGRRGSANDAFAIALLAILLIGLLAAGSRAGLGLAIPVLVISIGLRLRAQSGESPLRLVVAAGGLSVAVLSAVAFGPWLDRFSTKTATLSEADIRLIATPITFRTGWENFPAGTGFGTFDPVFRLVGGDANLGSNFVNHAHNEYVELWLTGGLPAMLLLAGFLWWFGGASRASWRARGDNAGGVPRVAAVTIAVILIHSLVDYPLRTAAIAAIFAASCALLLEPLRRPGLSSRGAHPYRHAVAAAAEFQPGAAASSGRGHPAGATASRARRRMGR